LTTLDGAVVRVDILARYVEGARSGRTVTANLKHKVHRKINMIAKTHLNIGKEPSPASPEYQIFVYAYLRKVFMSAVTGLMSGSFSFKRS
jgi:hypothetical protein